MSEKRFTIHKESKYKEEWYAYPFCIREDGEVVFNTIPLSIAEKVRDKLNEQQATIRKLQDLCGESDGENAKLRMKNNELQGQINRLNYIIEELRKNNYNKFELINKMKKEEKLYAEEIVRLNNEIGELRETNKEWLEFKELGGDY